MDFTEIREVDETTSYRRDSQTRQGLLPHQTSTSIYNPDFLQKPTSDNILDYEKILRDTPPSSPGIVLAKNNTFLKIIGEGKYDTVDEIIMTIEVSLEEKAKTEILITPETKKAQKQANFSDRTTDCGDTEEILEFGSKPFEKVPVDMVSKSYIEAKSLKSFLSKGIKGMPSPRGGNNPIKKGEMKTFKVYFFTKEASLMVPLNISLRVFNIIEQCMDAYKSNKTMDQSLLRYPDQPQAYDIKIGVDADPLDKKKELKSFPLSKEIGELYLIESLDYEKNKDPFAGDNEIILVYVHLPDEIKTRIVLEMKGGNFVKDIYTMLIAQKFPGCTSQNYNLLISSNDQPESKTPEPKIFLDTQVPLKNLKKYMKDDILILELVKKVFADDPTENRKHSDIIKELAGSPQEINNEDQIILYNEVSANRYEEFEVIKINESGRRQTRILGIDGFKIYNYTKRYKQEQQGGISSMINSVFTSRFGTMVPEFILLNINKIELVEPNGFLIETKTEGNHFKTIFFEALDRKDAKQIVAKLSYLKELEARKMN